MASESFANILVPEFLRFSIFEILYSTTFYFIKFQISEVFKFFNPQRSKFPNIWIFSFMDFPFKYNRNYRVVYPNLN